MEQLHPMLSEMILSGDKPREMYVVDCFVKLFPDPENVARVALYRHRWFLFAHSEDDARSTFWSNAPTEYMEQPLQIERVIAIMPWSGSISELDMLEIKDDAPDDKRRGLRTVEN